MLLEAARHYEFNGVQRNELGVVVRSFNEVMDGIRQMLDSQRLAHFRFRAGALNNRAVFEILDLLQALIAAAPGESEPAAFQAQA